MDIRTARNEMTMDLKNSLERTIDKHKGKPNYYILVVAYTDLSDNSIIRTKKILLKNKPAPQVGTMLYYVNNKKGTLERIWVLPRDIMQPEDTIAEGEFSDEIFYHGKAPNK